MTTELNKFQADIDKKFVHFNVELTDFKSTVTDQLDSKFKLVDDDFNALEMNILSRVDILKILLMLGWIALMTKLTFWMIK